MTKTTLTTLAAGLWLGALVFGLSKVMAYAAEAGPVGPAPVTSRIAATKARSRIHVTIALHPRCPCSVASLRELNRALSFAGVPVDLRVLAYVPRNQPEWLDEARAKVGADLPTARVEPDIDGKEAVAVGMKVSGHVWVQSPEGDTLFWGGITGSRGHEGPNKGADAFVTALRTGRPSGSAQVFGCPMQGEGT